MARQLPDPIGLAPMLAAFILQTPCARSEAWEKPKKGRGEACAAVADAMSAEF